MPKLKMMLRRDDVAAGRRRLHISSLSVMREATTALRAGIMQPPPTGRHRWNGIISPSERG